MELDYKDELAFEPNTLLRPYYDIVITGPKAETVPKPKPITTMENYAMMITHSNVERDAHKIRYVFNVENFVGTKVLLVVAETSATRVDTVLVFDYVETGHDPFGKGFQFTSDSEYMFEKASVQHEDGIYFVEYDVVSGLKSIEIHVPD